MSKRKTHEEFIGEMINVNPNIEIIGKYINAHTPIECICKICSNKWFPKPNTLLSGYGCRKCGYNINFQKMRKTHSDFVAELANINQDIKVIGKYINHKTKIECSCNVCKNIWFSTPDILLSGHGCPKCANKKIITNLTKSKDLYIKELHDSHHSITLIDNFVNMSTPSIHKCNKCNYSWSMKPSKIYYSGEICPVCNNSIVKQGINDLWTTHPHIAKLLYNTADGYSNTASSSKKVDWKCDICGSKITNKRINYVVWYKLSCPFCSDGISYPMKFVVSALKQLNVKFDTEVTFKDWSFDFHGYKYKPRYDIVFDKYIIEVDGGFHKRVHKSSKKSIEDIRYIDKMKDDLAKNNGYSMIRIDCDNSNMFYIRDNILSSELYKIFDLSNINWEECHRDALSSKIKEACDCWNNLKNPSVDEVNKFFKESRSTIKNWLQKGSIIGLCNYTSTIKHYKNSQKRKEVV